MKRKVFLFFLSVASFCLASMTCVVLYAAQSDSVSVKLERPSQLETAVIFEHYSYVRANQAYFGKEVKESDITTAGLSFYQKADTSIDGRWFFSPKEDAHYFDITEASHVSVKPTYTTHYGRHLEKWSESDEFWQTGLWQPRFYWDKLRTHENGLTGVFVQPKLARGWNATIFASPLYVPELGPDYKEDNGTVTSVNPWFRTPPPILELFDEPTEVMASVQEPSMSEVIFKPSIAGKVSRTISSEENINFAYAYKPVNQASTTFSYRLVPSGPDWKVNLKLYPIFIQHHIATLGYGRENKNWSSHVSYTYEHPVLESQPSENITQSFSDYQNISLGYSRNLKGEGRSALKAYTGYLKTWGGYMRDKGDNAQNSTIFELRQRYIEAYKVGVRQIHFRKNTDRMGLTRGLEAVYDPKQKGGALLAEVATEPIKNLTASFKVDLIGLTSASSDPVMEKGFFSSYRANDRFQLDVTYVY